MLAKELFKYNINDFLIIEDTKHVYTSYVINKSLELISIKVITPIYTSVIFNINDSDNNIKLLNNNILNIQKVNLLLYNKKFTYLFNKHTLEKNSVDVYLDYINTKLNIIDISNIYEIEYPIKVINEYNKRFTTTFSELLLNVDIKDLYKPKIKNENLIYNFNSFKNINNYYDF